MDIIYSDSEVQHRLRVASVKLSPEWDRFSQRCNSTYLCASGYLTAQRVTHHVECLELSLNDLKIGQCAVAIPRLRKGLRVFVDSLQVLPEYDYLWPDMMHEVLLTLGAGQYRYGSAWSVQPSRAGELQAIAGVSRIEVQPYQVHVVDFRDWRNWEAYRAAMSTNARRNVAKAVKADASIQVEEETGLRSLRFACQMLWLRRKTYQRKGAQFYLLRSSLRLLIRTIMLRQYTFIARVIFRDQVSAFVSGLRYGSQCFYIDGASQPDNAGSAWFLLTDTMQYSHQLAPAGLFVMGADPPDNGRRDGWENVLRQRQQCRVSSSPTSVVHFRFDP